MLKNLSKMKMQNINAGSPHWIVRTIYIIGTSAWKNRKHIKRGYRDGINSYKEF